MDRVWLQYGAGVAWNSSHPVTTHYLTNSASGDLSCKLYTTDGTTLNGGSTTHAAGTLYVTKTTDEDGNVSYTFVDGEERTLLERRMNGTEQLDTYYVYDDYGRLCFVLQPMYQTKANLSLYAFQYKYDNRNRCIWKKLPGAEHILYEYDEADRMAFSQDGNQRTTGKWTFYVYDNLNRLVQQGESNGKNTSGTPTLRYYYDDYSFVGTGLFTNQEFVAGSASAKGKLTGCQAYPINVASPARTVYHYDSKGRIIKETASNALGGFDIRTITYTFTDQPATVTHTHTANGKPSLTEVYTYTYDHSDRISSVTHKLNNGNTVTLASYTYDNKGRMATKKLHGSSSNQLTYAYNIRSWLTEISSNKFTQNLTYNNGSTGFNGNITAMNWTANGSSHSYAFTYDGVNRMHNATHGTGAYTEKVTEYDKNGNIKYLHRYNNGSLVDNLTYIYNGNRLTKVEDATGNTAGFKNGASQENEYTYDANGNLTKDSNKGIASITYNSLNLPQQIQYTNGFVVNYGYSADGVKQRVQHPNSGLPDVVYCGNVIYEGGAQKFLLTEEGYVDLANGNAYYYYLKDHQGNNRVVINGSGTVMETNHYYPFGGVFSTMTNVQPYKYNGKELDTQNDLNWYDYGARHYDAALGRWFVVDPLAEKYYSWNSYAYCKNNPINRIDIDGKDDYMINNKGWISIRQKTNTNTDRVFSGGDNNSYITINDISLLPSMLKAQNRPQNHHSAFGKTTNIQDAAKLFLFAAENSDVEWKMDVYKDQEEVTAIVITDHNEMSVENGQWAKKVTKTNGDKYIDIHSHPNESGKQEASDADRKNINSKNNAIYLKHNKTLYEYDKQGTNTLGERIKNSQDLEEYIRKRLK